MTRIEHVIKAPEGIHARPAGFLVKTVAAFDSEVRILFGEKSADGRKLFAIMKLGAKQGDAISVTAEGDDEDRAIAAIAEFLAAHF